MHDILKEISIAMLEDLLYAKLCSHYQGQGHNQGWKVESCFFSNFSKSTKVNLIELHTKVKQNEKVLHMLGLGSSV